MCHFTDMRKKGCMCLVMPLFGFDGDLVHQLCQLFISRLVVNVYKTIIIHCYMIWLTKVLLFFEICKY